MDEIWHEAILNTQFYTELQTAMGCALHHRPEGSSEPESEQRKTRLKVMTGIYRAVFSADPIGYDGPRMIYPPRNSSDGMQIFVKIPTGRTVLLDVNKYDTTEDVMTKIQDREGIPRDQQRLIHAGAFLQPGETLEENRISEDSTLFLTRRLAGC